jgi:aryl-alcohol dehydrogenase-like predicted oxidoreductase
LDSGINIIDTSAHFERGESEALIGDVIREHVMLSGDATRMDMSSSGTKTKREVMQKVMHHLIERYYNIFTTMLLN